MKFTPFVVVSLALAASARPMRKRTVGQDALRQNQQFATLTPDTPCTAPQNGCINNAFAQCGANGKFVLQAPCPSGTVCAAFPLEDLSAVTIGCIEPELRDSRIAQAGGNPGAAPPPPPAGGAAPPPPPPAGTPPPPPPPAAGDNAAAGGAVGNGGGDPQTSLTLLQSVIAPGFAQNGQTSQDPGQVASRTSTNNFINFCASVNKQITNGQQIKEGSCNPAPMGVIASTANMPSCKFISPQNLDEIPANSPISIKMKVQNLDTGFFTNPNTTYFSAPQEVNAQGNIQGHSHITIDRIESLRSTKPTDPTTFAYFKGLNKPAVDGVLSVDIPEGLPAGVYRLASINSAANHQPVLVAVAQHGSLDDMIYFTVV